MNRENRLNLFENELDLIHDTNVKDFAKEVIANADEYFFHVAASSSGKYHPTLSLGEGGLVRHTRLVVFFADSIAKSFMMSQHDNDLIILASLAHDIKKQGNGNTHHTEKKHPIFAADYLEEIYNKYQYIYKEDLEKVQKAVRSHMGQWGVSDGLPAPDDEFSKCLQAADYCASRKQILQFDFLPTKEPLEESKEDAGDYKASFGKYRGKSIKEIEKLDPGYFTWILSQESFSNQEFLENVKRWKGMV